MKEAIRTTKWCDSPYYTRELSDLYKVGSRVDAWREFLLSEKIDVLRRLGMSVCSFDKYSYFESLVIRLECNDEAEAINGLKSIMLAGRYHDVNFYRNSIHDKRAWAKLPLSCFAIAEGFNDWSEFHNTPFQDDILKFNQMPCFQIGIEKEWVVSPSDFTFSHKLKDSRSSFGKSRYAQISFNHPHLDRRFQGNQHVASGEFPRARKIDEVKNELMAEAMVVCAKHSVIVRSDEE